MAQVLSSLIKSPHFVDFSWDFAVLFVEFESNLGLVLADISRD